MHGAKEKTVPSDKSEWWSWFRLEASLGKVRPAGREGDASVALTRLGTPKVPV